MRCRQRTWYCFCEEPGPSQESAKGRNSYSESACLSPRRIGQAVLVVMITTNHTDRISLPSPLVVFLLLPHVRPGSDRQESWCRIYRLCSIGASRNRFLESIAKSSSGLGDKSSHGIREKSRQDLGEKRSQDLAESFHIVDDF